jgi:transposase
MKNIDINTLSKEELIKLIEKQNDTIFSKDKKYEKMVISKDKKYRKLEKESLKWMTRYNKAMILLENKMFIIKRDNVNKYVGTKENLEPIQINEAEANKTPGRKKGSKNFESLDLEKLVSKVTIKDIDQKVCDSCGGKLIKFGEDSSFKIYKKPTEYIVEKVVTPKYKCEDCNKIFQAINDSPFGHSPCTPSLAASIIDVKYNLGVPLYRYSKYLNDRGYPLSTKVLSNYVMKSAELLEPLYNALKANLVDDNSSNLIYADETPLKVIDNMKEHRTNSYMFVYVSSFYQYPIYIYDFNYDRKTSETKNLLKDFHGYLVVDGYAGYDSIASSKIKMQRCWAHTRRYFMDIVKTLNKDQLKDSAAYQVVNLMSPIFQAEAKFVKENLVVTDVKERRNSKEYKQMLTNLYDYVQSIQPERDTPLAKAVNYFNNRWSEMLTFLEDGHVELTNNISERAVKPFAICRRNFLFSKTNSGANASAILFSILQTARANGTVPELYLSYVLENINKKPLEDLLPWSKGMPEYTKQDLTRYM